MSTMYWQLPHRGLIQKVRGGFNVNLLKNFISLVFVLLMVGAAWFAPSAFAEPITSTNNLASNHQSTKAVLIKKQSNVFGPSIPIDNPTFCFGENDLGQCVLFFGSANSCNNINPCINSAPSTRAISSTVAKMAISQDDLTFCYGQDAVSGQCMLFAGPQSACESLEPCSVPFKRFK